MFSQKKIAVASMLMGGLALTGFGAAQAYAGGSDQCTRDAQANLVCTHKSETRYTSKDGTYHLQQKQDCTTVSRERVEQPEVSTGQRGTTKIGPTVSCSNTAPAPEGFVAPSFPH